MRSNIKKSAASILSMALVLSIVSVPVNAKEYQRDKDERKQLLFEAQVEQSSDNTISIDRIRDVSDFAGNKYTLIECIPTGYYIYHEESGSFVEYSPESQSPYKNANGPLYYGGPMEYFTKKGEIFIHTLETKNSIDQSIANELSEVCTQNQAKISVNQSVLNFIESTPLSRSTNAHETAEALINEISPRGTTAWVDGASYLRDIQYIPTNTEGTCGYVACCLVLWYWQRMGYSMIDSGLSAVQGLPNDRLQDQLRAYGSCGSAVGAVEILTKYCRDRNIPSQLGWNLAGIGMEAEIRAGRPVMLFGNLKYPYNSTYKNHAVVAYGWLSNGSVVANYGWKGYNYVIIQGIYGTNAHFRPM